MTDPSDALPSFQEALTAGVLLSVSRRGLIDPALWLHVDQPAGSPRFIYFREANGVLTALAIFARAPEVEGEPCLQVGYAVPEKLRGRGLAKSTLASAIAELTNGFAGLPPIYIEAIVDVDNLASRHVANACISGTPSLINDEVSGRPAYRYLRRVVPPERRQGTGG